MKFRISLLAIVFCLIGFTKMYAQTVINAGVAGNTSANLLARIDTSVLKHKPDLVILMVGTNDLLNSKKLTSYEQYESNLNKIVKAIKANGAEIVMMSSLPADSIYLFERHDRIFFKEAPNVKMANARQIVKKIAEQNGVKFLDLFQKFTDINVPKHNEDLYIRNVKNSGKCDGVHPTDLGYQFIAENVFECLKTNKLIKIESKIVCFGDSITYGSGSKKGKSYPSVLCNLMIEYFRK